MENQNAEPLKVVEQKNIKKNGKNTYSRNAFICCIFVVIFSFAVAFMNFIVPYDRGQISSAIVWGPLSILAALLCGVVGLVSGIIAIIKEKETERDEMLSWGSFFAALLILPVMFFVVIKILLPITSVIEKAIGR
jgi:hypothetical protein